ncbi:MAG: hypothetical protein VKK94_05500 [Cyanobacteriota bacterium]|nr:hypothetical protein [Cyanobacteriota bacterium]
MIQRLLRATLAGSLLGLVVALLLHAAIRNTPVQIPPHRFGWQVFTLALAGGLAGLALSSVIALQASNSDPSYHRGRSRRGRRRP